MAKVIGFELSSQEPEKAVQFYARVFGWEFGEPNWEYWPLISGNDTDNSRMSGGISKGPSDFPHGTRIQIEVESIDETLALATQNGAMVVREKMEFESFYLAYLVDPAGIGLGLIENK
ncbi:VOC family protein [Virgibacillus senegalensis]|uniref:VOC family protein n=1 Tax=Virgibacillus senegalensis TaxID=1499679 RepID=UPI00069DEBD6|nr:VOC family protein [Virgibacillus senegalensis]